MRPLAASNLAFQEDLQRTQNNLDEMNRKEGIRTGAKQVLPATNMSYLPQGDPLTPVKRAVVLLWPTFAGKNAGVGLLGTGFVVRRQGDRAWIVTALHVVRDLESNALATKVEAELFTGPLPAGVVAPRAEVLSARAQRFRPAGMNRLCWRCAVYRPTSKPCRWQRHRPKVCSCWWVIPANRAPGPWCPTPC